MSIKCSACITPVTPLPKPGRKEQFLLPILQMSKLSLREDNLPKVTQTLVRGSKGLKLEPMAFRLLHVGMV